MMGLRYLYMCIYIHTYIDFRHPFLHSLLGMSKETAAWGVESADEIMNKPWA